MDWFDNDDSAPHPDRATRPTVLLLPGLTGTSRESYILHMVQQSRELGYRWVVQTRCCLPASVLLRALPFRAVNTVSFAGMHYGNRSVL